MFGFKKRKAKEKPIQVAPTATDAQTNPGETNVRGQTLTSNACGGTNPNLPPQTAFREVPDTPTPVENTPVSSNRDQRLRIRLTQKEMDMVKRRAKEAVRDCSKYVRSVLGTAEVIHTPQPDCEALRILLNRPGRRLDDILARAYKTGFIDFPELEKALSELQACYREIAVYYGREVDDEKTAM